MAGNPIASGQLYKEWKACGMVLLRMLADFTSWKGIEEYTLPSMVRDWKALEDENDFDTFRVKLHALQERIRMYYCDDSD